MNNYNLINNCRISVILLLIFLCSCYDVRTNHMLSMKNNSNRIISILYSNKTAPDSNENNIAYYLSDQNLLKPDSSRNIIILGGENAWHNYIQKENAKRLFVYVFDVDTLRKYNGVYSINDLRNNHKYLKMHSYSEQELKNSNWRIDFKN